MIGQERIGELLLELVDTYSPSGQEAPAVELVADRLKGWGLETAVDEVGNLVARREGPAGAPRVLMLGHVDTVPGEREASLDDGEVHGRGAVDAKGPLVAHAAAAANLPAEVPIDVTVVGAVGEEATSRGARHLADAIEPPDALVIAEPTGLETVGLGYKGRLQAELVARAEPAHAGAPVPKAPERLLEAIDRWTERTANPDREVGFDRTTLRVTELSSRAGDDVEQARARVDLRFPGDPPEIDGVAATFPEEVELTVNEAVPGVRSDPRGPVATALRGALIGAGREPRAAVKTGTSDWNVVSAAWGPRPAAAYGPGDPALDHTPHERVAVEEVVQASEVLVDALGRLRALLDEPAAGAVGAAH